MFLTAAGLSGTGFATINMVLCLCWLALAILDEPVVVVQRLVASLERSPTTSKISAREAW